MQKISCVIASSKTWFFEYADLEILKNINLTFIQSKADLTLDNLRKIEPKFIFFPHWNWIVPDTIFRNYECVVFHTAPLPYGRGGSPIQNLIKSGYKTSPVNALRMTEDLDGGPIYCSREISLEGTITDIFRRVANAIPELILEITSGKSTPRPQVGLPHFFKRLTPGDSLIPKGVTQRELLDRIRMVDGEGYPPAYIDYGNLKIEFFGAKPDGEQLVASVRIVFNESTPNNV